MLKTCLFALLLASVNGALLGGNRCTWGPSYWCQSFSAASECGATDHCKEKVWGKSKHDAVVYQISGVKDSDSCTFCKDMITDVKNYIESNDTRATILGYMNRACDFMPDQFSMAECKKIEQHYLDLFLGLIKDNVDPEEICKLALLCGSKPAPKDLSSRDAVKPTKWISVPLTKASTGRLGDSSACDMCKTITTIIGKGLKNTDLQNEVKDLLLKECKALGDQLDAECETMVNQYMAEVFDFLAQEVQGQLCTMLNICPGTAVDPSVLIKSHFVNWLKTKAGDTAACDMCKTIATLVANGLKNTDLQNEVKDLLVKECKALGGSMAPECEAMVNQYLVQAFNFLAQEVEGQLCAMLNLCTNDAGLKSPLANVLKPKSGDASTCQLCKTVATLIANGLKDSKLQDGVKAVAINTCKSLSGEMVQECETLVDEYLPEVFSFLAQEIGDNMCSAMKLCPTLAYNTDLMFKARLYKWLESSTRTMKMWKANAVRDNSACDTCEEVVGYLKIFLSNNATEQQLAQLLKDDVCSQLGDMASLCNSVVDQYLPDLYAKLLQALDPATLCTDIGLCTKTVTYSAPKPKEVHAKASPTCILCEFVMDKLKTTLSDNATEEEIEDAVAKVCDLLPSTISTECHQMVKKYGDAIIHLLVNDVSAEMICTFLGLCSSGDSKYAVALTGGDTNCVTCELAMSYLQSMLKKNSTEEEITDTVEKLCNYLSGSMAKECNGIVAKYGPQIILMIANRIQPKDVCTKLGLCTSTAVRPKADGLVHLYKSSSNI